MRKQRRSFFCFFQFFQFFHFFCCGRYIWLTEMVLTFLEMGDHILRDYAIKNGGYMSLMQNKIVLKFENAIFFSIFPCFWNFETFSIRILLIWHLFQLELAISFNLSIITYLYDNSKLVKFYENQNLPKKSAKKRKNGLSWPKKVFFSFFCQICTH